MFVSVLVVFGFFVLLFSLTCFLCTTIGAAGQICYSFLPLLASGKVFGEDTMVKLHLLDITPALKAMEGVKMELHDGAYSNLNDDILCTDQPEVAFKDIDV